jgi:hypothetical protein
VPWWLPCSRTRGAEASPVSLLSCGFPGSYRAVMTVGSSRHRAVLDELAEWWEDVRDRGIGSRVVLVQVPPGWGARVVLDEFRRVVDDPAGPVTISVSVDEVPLVSRAIQARALRDALMTPFVRSRAVGLLGLDRAAGDVQLGLDIGSLFASGRAAAVALLLGSLAVTAVGNAWDASPAGRQGALARAARAVAAVSAVAPVAVLIDDADRLDPGLAVAMIENLASRYDGQVLVVAVVAPGSQLAAELRLPDRYGLLGRVQNADADPDMDDAARADLARELAPWLAGAAIERIAQRTRTFADVLAVGAADRLADLAGDDGPVVLVAVDAVISACLARAAVSAEATVLGWAGGALTVGQADRAVQVLGVDVQPGDPWVIRSGGLARLSDPASPRVAEQVAALADRTRHRLAAMVLEEAMRITRDPEATLVERVVARLAAHRVRADLVAREGLTGVQCLLIRGLERLGDQGTARDVAAAALAELPGDDQGDSERVELLKAVLRLARPGEDDDPVIRQAVDAALAGGAVLGLEARVWAAVNLLTRPGQRAAALTLADQITAELARLPGRDATANQWRITLAFQAGRAGYPAISQLLLAPVISSGTTGQQEAAQAVLRAIEDPRADTRLQIIMLEAELNATPPSADDELLHLHHVLAENYHDLGDYKSALRHGIAELPLSVRLQGPDHRLTLTTRHDIAVRTGWCGDPAEALRLLRELLPDQLRVLGRDHRDVLATRNDVAFWTGQCGDTAEALRLFRELLPRQLRVLGRDHPDVLTTRLNIAACTWACGDPAEALRLSRELLPDQLRVLGPDHLHVLTNRNNVAFWTGECGDPAEALRLFRELLPDQLRVLGPDHPDVLAVRHNVALWTGECGDPAEALRLFRELLPDRIRVLGPDHPDVMNTRNSIAFWTGECGDPAEALRLFRELLPDRIRVLGRDHPDVLTTRLNIATWTWACGDPAEALRLSRELLPDRIRVLGPDHPHVLTTRSFIATRTWECGDPAEALRLFRELLPDQIRVLGPDHPDVMTTRNNIAALTK